MIERLMILTGTALLFVFIFKLFKQQQLKQAQEAAQHINSQPLNANPSVVYFWSTQCSQCKSMQTPIINSLVLNAGEGRLTVSKFNISDSIERADELGVKTVPTVYILDKDGKVQHINSGLTTERILAKQLEPLYLNN